VYLSRTRSVACSVSSCNEQTVETLLSKDQQHIAVGMEQTSYSKSSLCSRSRSFGIMTWPRRCAAYRHGAFSSSVLPPMRREEIDHLEVFAIVPVRASRSRDPAFSSQSASIATIAPRRGPRPSEETKMFRKKQWRNRMVRKVSPSVLVSTAARVGLGTNSVGSGSATTTTGTTKQT
jgi:hypothetical protein